MSNFNQRRSFLQNVTTETFSEQMKEVYTCVPGHILTFDAATQRAQVQIGIIRVDSVSKTTFNPPPIVDVPVSFPGDDFVMEYAIGVGCEGMVHFSQRCIDAWKLTGGIAQNPVKRFHHKQDAMFVPGVRSLGNVIANFSNDGLRLRNSDATQYVWLKGDGSCIMANGNGNVQLLANGTVSINGVTIDKDGKIIAKDSLIVGGKELNNHTHGGVESGGSNTAVNN